MRVATYGESVLKKKTEQVLDFDSHLKDIAIMLNDTMIAEKGLGLAAPQIGISKAIFVIDMRFRHDKDTPVNFTLDGKNMPVDIIMPLYAVNPTLSEVDDFVQDSEEGCLSFPGIYAMVERMYKIKMNYQDLDGQKHELICEGLFARCVQHEFDHLQGITFVDRLNSKELFKIETKLRKLRKQTKEDLKNLK